MRKELNRSLEMKESNRQYVVNIAQLHEIIHDVNILLSMINGKKRQLKKKIEQIEKMLDIKKGQNKFCPWRLIIFDDYRFFVLYNHLRWCSYD